MTGQDDWEPVARSRTYELVLTRIEQLILDGRLRVGDRLPPERELSEMLGVSRAAIREALRVLEAQGALRPRVGTGPDSGNVIAAMPDAGLTQFLRLHIALAHFPLDDVVEARAVLERSSARLAAERAKEEDLARMREQLDRMDAVGLPREVFNDCDTDFHVAIAEAAGNRLVADLTVSVRNAVRQTLLTVFHRVEDWEAVAARLRAEHRAIYDAVAAGEAERAGEAVEAHIRSVHRDIVIPSLSPVP
ncbi:GntR family transcriptional regulator [Streptomyces abyssalis]|uniref:GntR family transcriptional regulator n=1 Tax=Streptomyces abyssalis TaxID=933944 RepID=A0A1E7JF87_9ACTN|nr:FadR/GntR family transcriptional regulator [Streptomyces abyssalis]OEU85128.1 GntR family transcriptional regulator [Streptomyces abyssalis]OEU95551.1 GntR family transcriptional regulator [Streptomyces abyssalis]OEV29495.1 GntR family transcriptional regulator [Streptomyces nanshensis]